ncbi:cupredoxin domain-containing protein [Levilactobacillus zymae]
MGLRHGHVSRQIDYQITEDEHMTEKQITVDGGYAPQEIHVKQGEPAQLTFKRVSDRGCLDQVHSAALAFKLDLPLNAPQTVTIPTDQAGKFDFSCGMDMVHGKVVIDR